MSYQHYQSVVFGTSKAGLATVGYALYNADGSSNGTRQTTGVQDLHGGSYGALVTFPDAFQGRLTWDTGETTPVYASENINDYRLDLSQNVPVRDVSADTTQTTGDCLSTSRADAAGNMTLDLAGKTQTIYGPDGTAVVRTFHVDNVDTPTQRT